MDYINYLDEVDFPDEDDYGKYLIASKPHIHVHVDACKCLSFLRQELVALQYLLENAFFF